MEFKVDGTLVTSDPTAPYAATWNASSATAGSHTIMATAYDAAGNSASSSRSVTVPRPADTTLPTVALTSPAAGATVSGSSVALAATAADNVGVARVEFKVDGTLITSDPTSPYAATWNASSATAGSHTIMATAYDAAGNCERRRAARSRPTRLSIDSGTGGTVPTSSRYLRPRKPPFSRREARPTPSRVSRTA